MRVAVAMNCRKCSTVALPALQQRGVALSIVAPRPGESLRSLRSLRERVSQPG